MSQPFNHLTLFRQSLRAWRAAWQASQAAADAQAERPAVFNQSRGNRFARRRQRPGAGVERS
jgi:hypothetical protein